MPKHNFSKTSVGRHVTKDITHSESIVSRALPSTEVVERRAQELALIAGRKPHEVTASDRIQAKRELLGSKSAHDPADDLGITGSGLGAPPTSTGRQKEKFLPHDDDLETEAIETGLDEAEHDTMLKASRAHTKSEG